MRTPKLDPCFWNWSTGPWREPAILVSLMLSLAFSGPQKTPTCKAEWPDADIASACELASTRANGDPLTPRASEEEYPGPAGSVAERVSTHPLPRLTEDCGHCYDMDDHHFAYSDPHKRNQYGPGHEAGAPSGWHRHKDLPGNCGRQQHATPCAKALAVNETIEEVLDALSQADTERLALLVANPRVNVVRFRSAIQVIGCDDETIVAHLPMRGDDLSALATFVAEQ